MSVPSVSGRDDFWELLHAALGLQHTASQKATSGAVEDAAYLERQALALLLEATQRLQPDEPALQTVRQLATSGLARLRDVTREERTRARRRPATARTP